MKQIKYSYCVDEYGNLVHINSLTDSTRHARQLYCLQCGQEMVANLGTKKSWYFSHKADTACDGESYLHKLAKRRIKEKFDSSTHFPITFFRDVPCCEAGHCFCCDDYYCMTKDFPVQSDLKRCNEKVIYDTCQEEMTYGEFRADLLLSHSSMPKREPVFIEIYKSHKSEEEKISSNIRIIETLQLKSESDIEDIINNGFVEGVNCEVHNFNPKLPSIRCENIPIERFVMFKSGSVIVHRAIDYEICCDKINQRFDSRSVIELNMKNRGIDIWGIQEETNTLDSYQTGLVYLVKKGHNIRNCIICKFYKYNDYYDDHICILYKALGLEKAHPKQSKANTCQRYELNPKLMSHPIEELEKEISEVP